MIKRFSILLIVIVCVVSCGKENYYDVPLPGIEQLRNDKSFVVGYWSLTRLEPDYNSSSWIKFNEDDTFTAYFIYPSRPYWETPSGTYTYSDAVATCTVVHSADSTSLRKLEFTTIFGRTSINKARLIYPIDEAGTTDTLFFELCQKK